MSTLYKRIHIIVNPASGKNEPIRLLKLRTKRAGLHVWHGREITLDATPDQPVWTDGEYYGRTPVTIKILPGALQVVVPA